MLELVLGAKGMGKTKTLVDKANNESKVTNGSIIYIDKNNKHMYELSNAIRLVCLDEYSISSSDAFVGFIQGIISSNHNLTHIFLDNFMKLSSIEADGLEGMLSVMNDISEKYDIDFVISTGAEENMIPEKFKSNIICVL
jgi:phosphohistidine swiveling domain-containing protein